MRTETINDKWLAIYADPGKELARTSDRKPVGTRARILASALDEWTEVDPAEAADSEREARYKARVVALIRERYDADDEMALLANAGDGSEAHAAEFAAWQQYRKECKARARAEVSGATPAADGVEAAAGEPDYDGSDSPAIA